MNAEKIKHALGKKAALLIQDNMYVGIGTGTTVYYFIEELGKRCKEENLHIEAIASSKESEKLAKEAGISLVEKSLSKPLDITVDGADAVSKAKSLIKGGGGALLREKILAKANTTVKKEIDISHNKDEKWIKEKVLPYLDAPVHKEYNLKLNHYSKYIK